MIKYSDFPAGDDLKRIVICLSNNGYYVSPFQAEKLWDLYSESMCASWMLLPESDNDLFYIVKGYLDEI